MDFEFAGTPEERRWQAEGLLKRIHRDLYGNGTPGILSRIEASLTKTATEDAMREKQHTENQEKLDALRKRHNLVIAILSLIATYLAFFRGHL